MTDQMLSAKERIDIVLKEYEAARKELEEDIRYLSTVGVTTGLGVAAGILGLRNQVNFSLVLMVIPLALLFLQSMRLHRLANAIELGRMIAKIENRVFDIAKEPLLFHETGLIVLRASRRPWVALVFELAMAAAYLGLACWLFNNLDAIIKQRWDEFHAVHRWSIIAIFLVPAMLSMYSAIRRFRTETTRFTSDLLTSVRTSHCRE
jgi:hypothetical protein